MLIRSSANILNTPNITTTTTTTTPQSESWEVTSLLRFQTFIIFVVKCHWIATEHIQWYGVIQIVVCMNGSVVHATLGAFDYGVYSGSPESRPAAVPPTCQRGSEHGRGPSAPLCTQTRTAGVLLTSWPRPCATPLQQLPIASPKQTHGRHFASFSNFTAQREPRNTKADPVPHRKSLTKQQLSGAVANVAAKHPHSGRHGAIKSVDAS